MKKIIASMAVASVTGSAFIGTVQAQTAITSKDTKYAPSNGEATYEKQVTVNTNVLRVRTGPGISNSIMGRVYEGQVLQVISEENGWFKINHNGKYGYISSEFVSENGASAKVSGTKTVNADVLRVRTGPDTSSLIIGRVHEGESLQVISEENGWFKINHNGKTGYVSSQFVADGSAIGSGNYTVNVSSLRVRTGPSTSHTILGSVRKGQVVQVTGEVQDWFKINYGGQVAYISKDYVSKGGSNVGQNNNVTVQTDGTYVVNTASLRVRTGPATYHSVIGGVLNGQTLQVTGAQNGWFKINHNGRTGYVSSQYVTFMKGNSSIGTVVDDYYIKASALNVRSGAGTNYRVMGALPKGTKVQVLSEQNGWSEINYNGKKGYISSKFLSKTKVTDATEQQTQNDNKASHFIKPAAGSYTSGFGKRGGQMHHGLDIAASGTVPVVAAADGVVTRSYYSNSYGNAVFMSHNLNGETYTTVYAHLNNRSVSVGQTVKQGQQLGFMGNTGQSNGQHLHFEVHKGDWNAQKSNAVDPKLFIQ
ncbi:peptidase M23 [Bacillus manliponensis]|uniref:Peptidase M23 n=1 Tax=Bacillus manliponensis TaxID=574376 RepID=A0A073JZV7_9BACI|nr:SH3 domain-containing protein [Bacillus manliponensis]KEK19737.1 peptidase M23 [Bacillus manliponensis]